MTSPYRRLAEDLPKPAAGGPLFAADPRKVKAWVAALPRANAQATEQELVRALGSLLGQKLDGGQRLGALEELRAAVSESVRLLESQFATNPLPLPPDKARAAATAESFHVLLGHGYRRAAADLCAPSGSVPFLKGSSVLQALERAAWHYSRALALAWRVYRPPAAGAWQGLHRVHRFAEAIKLDRKPAEDAIAGLTLDVNTIYVQTLLLAAVNPYAFGQTEQDVLWPIARGFAARCGLSSKPLDALAPVVPEDADRGPGPGAADETHSLWLELRPFSEEVDRALGRVRDGQADLQSGSGPGVRVGNDLLIRLRRAFGQIAARGLVRLPAGHSLDTVLGLSGLHYYLSGQRDFDTFMKHSAQGGVHVITGASWTQGSSGMSRVPRLSGRALDQSLGGYRMAWASADQARARVGELVGLSFGDEGEQQDWMVGVMRWLRYEDDGSLSAGVELLSRNASPVALRVVTADGGSRQVNRAVEIFPLDGSGGRCFISNASIDPGSRVEVVHDLASHFPELAPRGADVLDRVEVLLVAGDYVLLGERPDKPGEEAA
jgi:hypothetical protein